MEPLKRAIAEKKAVQELSKKAKLELKQNRKQLAESVYRRIISQAS